MCCCNWFASILLKIFASVFIMDVGLKFSFFVVESLPGFGIRMMDTILIPHKMRSHKMIWEGFLLFVLFGIVSEGMVPALFCMSGRIWL